MHTEADAGGWCAPARRRRMSSAHDLHTSAVVVMGASLLVFSLVVERQPGRGMLESDDEFQQPWHAQVQPKPRASMAYSTQPVEPFQTAQQRYNMNHDARVSALPWYTSASQQDEKWGGVHQSNALPNVMQNAYLYAQHVAQSHTGQLLRWRNYVTQRRSDATPKEQLAQAKGMAYVAATEYNQARAQLAAIKKMAVIRRLNTKRQEAKELTGDVNKFATGMLRQQDLSEIKKDEACMRLETV